MFNEGVSRTGDLLDLAVAKNIVKKSGSWFSYNDEKLGQGREGVKQKLADDEKLCAQLEAEVRKAHEPQDKPEVKKAAAKAPAVN